MCAVSAVGDYWQKRLPDQDYWRSVQPFIQPMSPGGAGYVPQIPQVTKVEFDALKRDVEELKKLLLAAKKFDDETSQPDCETDDKVALIKKLAALVGVSVDEIFGGENAGC